MLHTNQFNNNLSFAVNSVNFLLPTSIIGAVLFWTRLRAQKLKVVVLCGSSAIRIQWRNLRSIYQTWESQRRGYGSQWTQYFSQISILLINMQGAGYSGEPWDRKSRRRMIANMMWRWLWRWCLEKLEAAPPYFYACHPLSPSWLWSLLYQVLLMFVWYSGTVGLLLWRVSQWQEWLVTLMCGIILAKGEMATASTQLPNSNHHHLVCSLIIKVPAKYIILVGHQQLGEIIKYKILQIWRWWYHPICSSEIPV